MHEPDFLRFASDATMLGLVGLALVLISAVAAIAERRRLKRRHIDAVGCMPWTTLFMLTFFPGACFVAMAVIGWLHR